MTPPLMPHGAWKPKTRRGQVTVGVLFVVLVVVVVVVKLAVSH